MLQHQQSFDQTGDARRGLQVAKVSLHRPDEERGFCGALFAECRCERMRLDRITHRCASSMGLDKSDLRGSNPSVDACLAHQPCLRLSAGKRDPIGVAVLVKGRTNDHSLNRVAVRNRLREPLQQHHACSFAADETIGRCVERFTPALWRQHRRSRKTDKSAGRNHHRNAAC